MAYNTPFSGVSAEKMRTARSVEDEIQSGHGNAKRHPNWNQETTFTRLFSNFQVEKDLEQ